MIDKAKIRKAHKVYTNVDGVQMCEMQFSKYLVMEQALTELEVLKRDVKRFMEIANDCVVIDSCIREYIDLRRKLSKVGKKE
ncbi:MAG: hypothetical protein RBR50_10120 [Candidatus Izemoplasmatales bacterium]|nr:hypothetical protein [Candidatus Izemoplasmatales bacterium]